MKGRGIIMNLTLSMDAQLINDARAVAFERDQSLTEMIRSYLKDVVNGWRLGRKAKAQQLMEMFRRNSVYIGKRDWTREDLYERR